MAAEPPIRAAGLASSAPGGNPGYLDSGGLASVIPRSVSTLGLASSMASRLWQALQSCVMACAALGGVVAVVAAEAAGEIRVADVVGIRAPGDVHLGEDVAVVDRQHLLGGGGHFGLALRPDGRIVVLVVAREGRGDLLGGLVARGVVRP